MRFFGVLGLLLSSILLWEHTTAASTLRNGHGTDYERARSKNQRRRQVQNALKAELQGLKRKTRRGTSEEDPSRHLEMSEPESAENQWIVKLSETPLLICADCADQVQAQQDQVLGRILELFPGSTLMFSTQKLVNAIYVQLPKAEDGAESADVKGTVLQIEGVLEVVPHGNLEMDAFDAAQSVGAFQARRDFCGVSGRGVKVAVLDSGIDYTHAKLGGPGTQQAYREAYGTGPYSLANRRRDGLFPTDVVVDGYDFVGEFSTLPVPDEDPIDSFGHGTAVADAILTVAPSAKLVAIKVCSVSMACPAFSLIRGLEYSLDPNNDNTLDGKVDVINLSLGIPWISPFYSFVSSALETVVNEFGVVVVTSAGNSGNLPFSIGGISGAPSSIAVGATGQPDTLDAHVMANYSSRGPGEGSMLKPNIVAPSNLTLAAVGTGNMRYRNIKGTSFSAPLVAGAVALVLERCPDCSPFAVKALLMNNAMREVRYVNYSTTLSPVTLSGAGEMQVDKTLGAGLWAYSVEDVQASISLGLVNAAYDVTFTRTIKVINLSNVPKSLSISYVVRNPRHPYVDAMQIELSQTDIWLAGGCNSEALVEVTFSIDASLAPPNHLTSSGRAGFNATNLDIHELGGFIIVESDGSDISLPFAAIVRQASDVTSADAVIPDLGGTMDVPVSLVNRGAGMAQVDAYQLVLKSPDDPESGFGQSVPPNDFRYIGYRVLDVDRPGCTHLVEFAFNTWEQKRGRLVTQIYAVDIDIDGDDIGDVFLFNSGLAVDCLVADGSLNDAECTGLPPDHGTNSANTVLRACSEDLGIADFTGQLGVRFEAATFNDNGNLVGTDRSSEDESEFILVDFPMPALRASSYDVYPGQTLEEIQVEDRTNDDSGQAPLGLMLVTNSYRSVTSTGASTPDTEAIVFLREGLSLDSLPSEATPDRMEFPPVEDLTGPQCAWMEVDSDSDCEAEDFDDLNSNFDGGETIESPMGGDDSDFDPIMLVGNVFGLHHHGSTSRLFCTPLEVPRAAVMTVQQASDPHSSGAEHTGKLPGASANEGVNDPSVGEPDGLSVGSVHEIESSQARPSMSLAIALVSLLSCACCLLM